MGTATSCKSAGLVGRSISKVPFFRACILGCNNSLAFIRYYSQYSVKWQLCQCAFHDTCYDVFSQRTIL